MAVNEFEETDFLAEARDRVTEAFKDKDIFDRYLQLLISGHTELQFVFKDLMQKRSLDTATGSVLDIIGDIVGQSRQLVGVVTTPGGNPSTITLDDDTYRLFIRSKILKNVTRATPEEIIHIANFIFQTSNSTIQNEGNAAFSLFIGKDLTDEEKALLNYTSTEGYGVRLIPKPVGVRINYGEFDNTNFFAFEGANNAKGYGDLGDPSVGGKWASLIEI